MFKTFAQKCVCATLYVDINKVNFLTRYLNKSHPTLSVFNKANLHINHILYGRRDAGQHKRIREQSKKYDDKWTTDLDAWTDNNKMLYPPLDTNQGIRPAEIYHGRKDIRYTAKKMYQVSRLIINMNIDEAITRLGRIENKAAEVIREVLLEAQELAVDDHNVEFKSNLHIVESFATPEGHIPFVIYHVRGARKKGRMRFVNYYVKLREGAAPPPTPQITALQSAQHYLQSLRNRTIQDGL